MHDKPVKKLFRKKTPFFLIRESYGITQVYVLCTVQGFQSTKPYRDLDKP